MNMENYKHINEITLIGDDEWTKSFNRCSEYFQKAFNNTLDESVQKENFNKWVEERWFLEMGYFNQE